MIFDRWRTKHANHIAKTLYVGCVVSMAVAKRSHVKSSYFVEVLRVSNSLIEVFIPKKRHLIISDNNGNWVYQLSRMTIIGDKRDHEHLIHNQELI